MAKATATVEQFMAALVHPRKAEIAAIREAILKADPAITEQVKWNAPSFCYGGDDRVTFRLHPPEKVQLIFHRGARVKDATGFVFEDTTGLMSWAAPDRAVVAIADVADRPTVLADLVRRWMAATSE
ncbi:MAG: DUF1801 domain-containing protein [Candidatus Sericytochromatia bacterium]